jgi:formyltetrahydrofolate synthetase
MRREKMSCKTDIEIAQETPLKHIREIAATAGVDEKYLEQYGNYKAKIDYNMLNDMAEKPDGKLILVTAVTPTPAGEGKTTTTVGLSDGLRKIGKKSVVALREPSLGPVFGIKGGAAGGGYAQVVPMEDINLHFTGDFHAIGAANNLLAAMLDNHIFQGNTLGIDNRRITWRRCVDMNDRQLRFITEQPNNFKPAYDLNMPIEEKLNAIATKVYHADGIDLAADAKKQLKQLTDLGFGNLPICMAKTQYSFSDNQALLGAPKGFRVTVRNLKVSAGAGFIAALTGEIMTMPGLPKIPSAEKIDVDSAGKITGLF